MDTKIRKQIYLEPQQNAILKAASKKMKVSEAEIIRQAIMAQTYRMQISTRNSNAWEKELSFLRSLEALGSLPGGRQWQRDDLYERKNSG
jgi:microsomal dipeptidase-like Zn-dependent dipeptidase